MNTIDINSFVCKHKIEMSMQQCVEEMKNKNCAGALFIIQMHPV